MFTGIIEATGKILERKEGCFTISCDFVDELHIWQSIAHDGACMTITDIHKHSYSFFAMEESFTKTNFGNKAVWDSFNIERCLQVNDRLDGHFVTWHVDALWTIEKKEVWVDGSIHLGIHYPTEFDMYATKKWSITINGISLTIVDNSEWYLSVWIIPHTMEVTNLQFCSVHTTVNLEFDLLAKYVANMLPTT